MRRVCASVLIRESARNVLSFGWLSAIVFVAAAAIAFAALAASFGDTRGIVERSDWLGESGAYLMYVSPKTEGALITNARCDSMLAVEGVRAAGATESSGYVSAAVDAQERLLVRATSGYPAIVWPTAPTNLAGEIYVGSELAKKYGLVDGANWAILDQGLERNTRVIVMPPSLRFPEMDLAAVEVVNASDHGAVCAVEAVPGRQAGVASIASSWFSPTAVTISPFPVSVGPRPPQAEYAQRLTLWAPYLAAAAILATIASWWKIRERDFALYSIQGVNGRSVMMMLFTETVILTVLPVSVGVTIAAATFGAELREPVLLTVFAHDALVLAALAFLSPVIGLVLLPRSSALRRLRS